MDAHTNKAFGGLINRLIQRENLTYQEAKDAFYLIINNQITDMQQGAFLAALTAKGETDEEIAGCWEAIYDLDTAHVDLDKGLSLVENCGTGMDTFKTFNISTAASILSAAGGIKMAKHGARAITSVCGTVDMAETIGIDVECGADVVAKSIKNANIGLFNGMSPQIHPNALGRILSQIAFGSTLNIAASLANPALPKLAVRGVYSRDMLVPVSKVMKKIGYRRAMVIYGEIDGSEKGMDEASVCGTTHCAELQENGDIMEYQFRPSDVGLSLQDKDALSPMADIDNEARKFVGLITGKENGARREAVCLNAGLIYYISGKSKDIKTGINMATETIHDQSAIKTLENWVTSQNREPEKGLEKLGRYI